MTISSTLVRASAEETATKGSFGPISAVCATPRWSSNRSQDRSRSSVACGGLLVLDHDRCVPAHGMQRRHRQRVVGAQLLAPGTTRWISQGTVGGPGGDQRSQGLGVQGLIGHEQDAVHLDRAGGIVGRLASAVDAVADLQLDAIAQVTVDLGEVELGHLRAPQVVDGAGRLGDSGAGRVLPRARRRRDEAQDLMDRFLGLEAGHDDSISRPRRCA